MKVRGEEIIGAPIISEKEGKELGRVQDLVYDSEQNKVIAFIISMGDVLSKAHILPLSEVKQGGKDAIVVKSQESVKMADEEIKPQSSSDNSDMYLKDVSVVLQNGEKVGNVYDLSFDLQSGEVQEYEVKDNGEKKKVPVKKVMAATDDTAVIEGEKADFMNEEKAEGPGDLAKEQVNRLKQLLKG